MKRILVYLLITAALALVPLERTDVADLRPVQTVALYKTPEGYRIETDTQDVGSGKTVDSAYQDLLDTTSGIIYLDTADFLLISEAALPGLQDMDKYLKNGVKACSVIGEGDLKAVSKFLSVQTGLRPFSAVRSGDELPVLDCRTDRIKFLQKKGK